MDSLLTEEMMASLSVAMRRALDQHLVGGLPVEIIGWNNLAAAPAAGLAAALITPHAARAEQDAIRAFASLGSDAPLDLLHQNLAHDPPLRHALAALATTPAPPPDVLDAVFAAQPVRANGRPPPGFAESSEIWLRHHEHVPVEMVTDTPVSDHTPITPQLLNAILTHLPHGLNPLDLLFVSDAELTRRTCRTLFTAVMVESVWATGIRPAEWPSAEPWLEIDGQRVKLRALYQDSLKATRAHCPPRHNRNAWLAHVRGQLVELLDRGPLWITVRNAKARFLHQAGLPERRSIGLHEHSISTRIAVFCAAMTGRDIGPKRLWENPLQNSVYKQLVRVGTELQRVGLYRPPCHRAGQPKKLNLYTMRHDFIDRAKSAGLSAAEISAIAGHSSPATKAHYGRARSGGGRALSPRARPDEVAAYARHHETRREQARDRQRARRQSHRRQRPVSDGPVPAPTPSSSPF
ncbi:MAG: hypothetical protein OXC53_01425 [Rhodobacteraceae bacterium]|nr:hypothetical protein [Paracoccaceae bacterium]